MNNTDISKIKKVVDIQLPQYPKLNELVGNDNKRYAFYRPYMYDTTNTPQFSIFKKNIEDIHVKLQEYCKILHNCPPEELNDCFVISIFEKALNIAPWLDWSKIYYGQCAENPSKELIEMICEHFSTDPSLDEIRVASEIFALGGILYDSTDDKRSLQLLRNVESFLEKYPLFSEDCYGRRICFEIFDVYAEMKVYDQLVNMGFSPEH